MAEDVRIFEKIEEVSRKIGIALRNIVRGAAGQNIEEDEFSGLIDVSDVRERTRLSEYDVSAHSVFRILASKHPELSLLEQIADEEDHYYISLEGEQRKEAILMQKAKQAGAPGMALSLQLPTVETKIEEPVREKKGFVQRIRGDKT